MSVDQEKAASLITPFFEVRQSQIQGNGAFATKKIRKGQRIIEYVGERISDEEADRRYDESRMDRHHTFLFTLDEDTVIDGAVGGNASIYINHSCAPNCEAVIEGNRIYIYSLRSIEPNEELLYDYQYERENNEELVDFYKCLCGAPNCRGTIMKAAEKPKRKKKKVAKKSAKKTLKLAKKGNGKAARKSKSVSKGVGRGSNKTAKKAAGKKAGKTGRKAGVKAASKTRKQPVQRSAGQTRKRGTMKKAGTRTKRTGRR